MEKMQFLKNKIKCFIILLFLVISTNNNASSKKTYKYRCSVYSLDYTNTVDKVDKYTFNHKVDKLNAVETVALVGTATLASLGLLGTKGELIDLKGRDLTALINKRYAKVSKLRKTSDKLLLDIKNEDLAETKKKIKRVKREGVKIENQLIELAPISEELTVKIKQLNAKLKLNHRQLELEISKLEKPSRRWRKAKKASNREIKELKNQLRTKQRIKERKLKLKIRKAKLAVKKAKMKGIKLKTKGGGIKRIGKLGTASAVAGGTALLTIGTAGAYALGQDKYNHKKYCKQEFFKDTPVAKESRKKHNAKYPELLIAKIICEYEKTNLSGIKHWERCN
jgi:hypothetical protein